MRPTAVGSLNFVIVFCWGSRRSPISLRDTSLGVRPQIKSRVQAYARRTPERGHCIEAIQTVRQ